MSFDQKHSINTKSNGLSENCDMLFKKSLLRSLVSCKEAEQCIESLQIYQIKVKMGKSMIYIFGYLT